MPPSDRMSCEWCESAATYRIKSGTYRRFACSDRAHRAKTDRLVAIDIGDRKRETFINGNGFSSETGRVRGAS